MWPPTVSSSFLSFHQESYVSQSVPSQCLAQPMAMSLAVVRFWGEQAVSIMGQTSRSCMVCLMPQSQISGSLENPHFSMFTLDRPTCVRYRLRAFQVVQGFSAPAGRCSSALMLRCTLASMHAIKLFRDLRRGTTPRCLLSGCLSSVACRVRSVRFATALLMSDGAIPASTGRLLVFIGFRHPVTILRVSFSVASSFFAWVQCSHTGQAYSAAE